MADRKMTGARFLELTNLKEHRKDEKKDPARQKIAPPTEEEVVMLTDEITRLRSVVRCFAFDAARTYQEAVTAFCCPEEPKVATKESK